MIQDQVTGRVEQVNNLINSRLVPHFYNVESILCTFSYVNKFVFILGDQRMVSRN